MNTLEQKKADRLKYLHHLYKVVDGSTAPYVEASAIGEDLGFSREQTLSVIEYLKGEGLLTYRAMGPMVSISHRGVLEVEAALRQPERPTEYFPPAVNIIHVGSMVNSQIQQGGYQNVQRQSLHQSATTDIREFIALFRQSLPALQLTQDAELEATAEFGTIEAQLASPKPKLGIVRESLTSLRTILEGAAGSVVASDLLPRLVPLIASIT